MRTCEVCGEPLEFQMPDGHTVECRCSCQREPERPKGGWKSKRCFGARHGRMASMTFDADDGNGGEAMRIARRYADRFPIGSDGLLLFGSSDQGKTFTAACIANALLSKGFGVVMRSVPEIVYHAQRSGFDDWLSDYRTCDLLVLDDIGAERTTGFAQETVYNVVDTRYSCGRPMVATTNLTREELFSPNDVVSRRIYGRLLEVCLPVEVDNGRKRSNRWNYERMRENLGI